MNRYHPDKNANNPEASELFKEAAYSYSILADPEKRRSYDNAGFEVDVYFVYHISCLKLIIRLIEVLFCDNIIGFFLS